MRYRLYRKFLIGAASVAAALLIVPIAGSADEQSDALSAAWPGMAENATVVDWEGNVLQEGSNGYTCLPTPPMLTGTAPMCMDGGPYVMWKGTPYAHLMVPIGSRD